MQEDWESIDLKKCLFSCSRQTCCLSLTSSLQCSSNVLCDHVATFEHSKRLRTRPWWWLVPWEWIGAADVRPIRATTRLLRRHTSPAIIPGIYFSGQMIFRDYL